MVKAQAVVFGLAAMLLLGGSCRTERAIREEDRAAVAERYFRAVYGGEVSVVDELAGENLVVSYPGFEGVFGTPALHGREAVEEFVTGFATKWAEPEFEIHEAVVEGDKVVLVWSFRARNIGPLGSGQPATNEMHGWGGITLFRFDDSGRIIAEIGEESDPGPAQRVGGSGSD